MAFVRCAAREQKQTERRSVHTTAFIVFEGILSNPFRSGRSAEFHDRQMLTARMETNGELELSAGPASNQRVRPRAGSRPWPPRTWLEAWRTGDGPRAEVDLVRGSREKAGVRSLAVVPRREEAKLMCEGADTNDGMQVQQTASLGP